MKSDVGAFHALVVKAGVMSARGDFAAAERVVAEADRLARQLQPGTYDAQGLALRRAEMAVEQHQPVAALAVLTPMVEPVRTGTASHQNAATALRLSAEALTAQGDYAAALRDAGEALAHLDAMLHDGHPDRQLARSPATP